MSVGQIEKRTQAWVVKLFHEKLRYNYLGNWIDREDNRNIEPELVRAFLKKQGHDDSLIGKVLYQIEKAAGDASKSLYDRNRAVYGLLRYGVKVKADVGENTQTVWLIDWKRPLENNFGIAEEVTVPASDAKAHDKRQTPEKYYLTWKEDSNIENLLNRALTQLCGKERFLELIHNFILFDAGIKKLCRHSQYFAVRASQEYVGRHEGGIIWNTQALGRV